MSRVSTLNSTEDSLTDFESGIRCGSWDSEDRSCELGTANPRQGRLVLVFSLDLQDIEEIGTGRVDLDEVLVCCW
jgi:hypothetical protein